MTPEQYKSASAVLAVLELIQTNLSQGKQVVVIDSRHGITNEIQRRLEECGVRCSRIDSTISNKASQAVAFKGKKTHVMLMTPEQYASGYSFDQCDTLIIGSIEYTPGSFTQAFGR